VHPRHLGYVAGAAAASVRRPSAMVVQGATIEGRLRGCDAGPARGALRGGDLASTGVQNRGMHAELH